MNTEDQFLVDEGKAYAESIVNESPARPMRLAVAELQTNVAKISDARLPIRAEAEDGPLFIVHDRQRYTKAQALYKRNGRKRDTAFFRYKYELPKKGD